MTLEEKIASEEGFEPNKYICPTGFMSIGYGFNIDVIPMPKEVADLWLSLIVRDMKKRLAQFDWIGELNEARQVVLYDMAYQMGINGMLSFTNMINSLRAEKYCEAASHLLDSKYARQTPGRASRNAEILRSGVIA